MSIERMVQADGRAMVVAMDDAARNETSKYPATRESLSPGRPSSHQRIPSTHDGGLTDGDGRSSDWIEIHNAGDESMDLAGFHLTDNPDELTKWTFPSVTLDAGDYLVLFASGRSGPDYIDSANNLHTNFTLKRSGEYLGLISPKGTIVSEFGSATEDYPEQIANVSFGPAQSLTLSDAGSDAFYLVPIDDSHGTRWTLPQFEAAANGFTPGVASVGLESAPRNRTNFVGQFETELPIETHAVYLRVEFELADSSAISSLELNMKYDNGFAAYLNGVAVASAFAPENLSWFSSATSSTRRDAEALESAVFDLSDHTTALVDGTNVLAIHGLNSLADGGDMLIVPELHAGTSDMFAATGGAGNVGYMAAPSPGRRNAAKEDVKTGFVEDTKFSLGRGFYDSPQQVTISTATEDAQLYYTLDGSKPSPTGATSQLYSSAIPISERQSCERRPSGTTICQPTSTRRPTSLSTM